MFQIAYCELQDITEFRKRYEDIPQSFIVLKTKYYDNVYPLTKIW